jgi:hypothetical protein
MKNEFPSNMNMKKKKTAILVLTHINNNHVIKLFNEIKNDCSSEYSIFMLCDNTKNIFNKFNDREGYFRFSVDALSQLGYLPNRSVAYAEAAQHANPFHKNFNFIPGNTILPLMLFYRCHPNYDFYWIVEYDVRFSGRWSRFFRHFADSSADLLGTTLVRHVETPDWYHWPSLELKDDTLDSTQYLRGFFPIYRVSHRAVEQLDRSLAAGNRGHYECLMPTLLYNAGMLLEDIGGEGEFVQPANRNRFYRNTPSAPFLAPGTFIFRPIMQRAGSEPNKLWHPVKPRPWWLRAYRVARASLGSQILV